MVIVWSEPTRALECKVIVGYGVEVFVLIEVRA